MKISKKGFTLVELLIVIAIIGILASALLVSLGSARRAGRDARRIGDLRNMQAILELYFTACGNYPNDGATLVGSAGCTVPEMELDGVMSFAELQGKIAGVGSLGVTVLPQDPINTGSFVYDYAYHRTTASDYVLRALLELDNPVLESGSDIDGDVFTDINGAGAMNCGTIGDRVFCVGSGGI